ncbi:ABC transporter substrate-binding protein [Lachnoclostridium sp. An169]|uniref:ABC transporter substrate-binding protein n=1 Tax=Lachnoclostridium sp. An169 TaxID=1965569 RepID=UPI000B3881A0|nr:extracellular solute-binding protein [Lachnoclostridium sp. An169]OUP83621.1 ABC transporter substrate-binding protein [Lachnoclostridium sp. An169]
MKKKKILALLMAAAMVVGLAACSSGGDADKGSDNAQTTEDNGEQKTLRMAWWGSQTRHDITMQAIELYEKEHPDINIEYEYYSFDDYFTKLKTLVASDQVWDIFQLGGNFPEYMDKIHFLNEYVDSGIVDTSDISDAYLKTTEDTEGNLIGLSLGVNAYGIAYDPAIFEEAGAELPKDGWTWDDYYEAATKIHDELGIFGCSSFGSSEFIAGCSTYIAQYGEHAGDYNFFNIDLTGMGFDDPQMLTPYIQMRADMIEEGSYPDSGAAAEITNIENDFLVTGEAGMTWVAVNQFPTIYDVCAADGRELALAPLPRIKSDGPTGIVTQSSQMLCVSEDSEYKEDAAEFINWFVNSTECNDILQGERGIPIPDSVRESLSSNATDGQKIMYDYMDLISTYEVPEEFNVLSPAGQDQVVDNYRNYIDQVVFGEITAEEAADKTYADAEALFK